jgi:CRISPR-associated endonuclease/helicase Cas3
VPRDKDLFDLFDTSPDLTGAEVDVSRFIRDGEELDVQVFWREVAAESQPAKKVWPDHRELCPVPFYLFRDALPSMRKAGRVWCRNYRKGWELVSTRNADLVYPGQVYLLEKSCGGYSPNLGWTGNPDHVDFELPEPLPPTKETLQDDEDDADDLSQLNHNQWLSVLEHTRHVCQKLDELLRDCDLPDSEQKILTLAARWHDRGKAHPVFQAKIKLSEKAQEMLAGEPAAKAPDGAWQQSKRPGFRHELASALALLETLRCAQPDHEVFAWPEGLERPAVIEGTAAEAGERLADELARLSADELDLFVYLVAAHHGKVRMSIRSAPHDERTDVPDPCPDDKRQARGVRDGEELPPCRIPSADLNSALVAPAVTLSLDPMELGLSDRYGPSWRERTQLLLERLGPFRLAFLEGLLRAADCRASNEEEQGTKRN